MRAVFSALRARIPHATAAPDGQDGTGGRARQRQIRVIIFLGRSVLTYRNHSLCSSNDPMSNPNRRRKAPSEEVEIAVLWHSQRRCCLCFYLDGVFTPQQGQIVHIDRDPSNSSVENLAFLCLKHHDEYDSRRSQSKGFKPRELILYRDKFYEVVEEHVTRTKSTVSRAPIPTPSNTEMLESLVIGKWQFQKGWETQWSIGDGPALFAYRSPNGFDGICRIEAIGLKNGKVMVVCEQTPDNPGMSITNAIEFIAFEVCRSYEIDPDRLILVEHYEEGLFGKEGPWLWVQFKRRPPESFFEEPAWHEIEEHDWRYFGVKPTSDRRARESLMRDFR
jgi:hypothetical protein